VAVYTPYAKHKLCAVQYVPFCKHQRLYLELERVFQLVASLSNLSNFGFAEAFDVLQVLLYGADDSYKE